MASRDSHAISDIDLLGQMLVAEDCLTCIDLVTQSDLRHTNRVIGQRRGDGYVQYITIGLTTNKVCQRP